MVPSTVYVSVNRHYSIKIILIINIQSFIHPVRVNPIPRQIPPSPKYLRLWVRISIPYGTASTFLHFLMTKQAAAILSGILPFGTFFHRLHDTPDLAPDIGIGRRCVCRNVLCPFEPFCIKSVLCIRIPRPHSWHRLAYNSHCDNLVHIFLSLC